jgi:3-phenylpropionate/cinnamic acid dioxygenase small subunit
MPEAIRKLTPATSQQWWTVAQFLHYEADLLDHREFDEWLGLLDEGIRYRMPIARNVRRNQNAPEYTAPGEIAWFDEGIATLRQRVAQLKTGIHWAEEPGSRVSHLVTNIRILAIEPLDGGDELVRVRSRFLVNQNRHQTENALFVGKREDQLRMGPSGIRLLQREIFLDQSVLMAKALTTFF